MKFVERGLRSLAAPLLAAVVAGGAAHAENGVGAVMLVATPQLDDSPFRRAVVVATRLPQGGHIGFIINQPTGLRLENLLPDRASTQRDARPVYVGGPVLPGAVFALTRSAPVSPSGVVRLMPGLFAVLGGDNLGRVIDAAPSDARYFVGLAVWTPHQLYAQVQGGAWEILPADPDTVLRSKPAGLWRKFRQKSHPRASGTRWY